MKTAKMSSTLIVRGLMGVSASGLILLAMAGCDGSDNPPSGSISVKASAPPEGAAAAPAPVPGKKGAKGPQMIKTLKGVSEDR